MPAPSLFPTYLFENNRKLSSSNESNYSFFLCLMICLFNVFEYYCMFEDCLES